MTQNSSSGSGPGPPRQPFMRAAAFNCTGRPEVLQPCLWSKPEPAEGRVLVRVVAASVNPVDAKIRAGAVMDGLQAGGTHWPLSYLTRLPKVPGGDLAGVVEHAGHNSRFKQGDRVFALVQYRPHVHAGAYAEYASVPEQQLACMPEGLSFEEASGVPLVSLTVWQGLEHIGLPPGSRILIHGGSGAVGSVAIQFAKHIKRWHVTATCSPANVAYCKELGADVVHDWRDAAALPKLYGHEPFDVVFDVVGGRITRDSLAYLKRRGRLVHVLVSEANAADLLWMLFKGVLGLGPRLSLISVHPNGRQLGAIARLLGSGTLRPPLVSATFPLEQAGEAHAFLEGERGPRPPGKVVLQVARPVLADKGSQAR